MNSGLSPVALGSEGDIFWGQYQSCSLVLMWQIAKSWGFEVVIFSVGFWLHGDFVCFTHENNAITSAFIIQSFRFRLLLQRRNKLPFEPAGGWHMWLEFFLSQAISFPRPQEVEPDKWGSPQDRVGQWVESWHAPSRGMIPCCFFFPRPSLEVTVYRTMMGNDASICFYNPYKNRIYIILHLCFWPLQK